MFETLNRAEQGDLGEARAIYELCKLGYIVSKPLHTHIAYDLIADMEGILYKVQVKTSGFKRRSTDAYEVQLQTTGGNRIINTRKHFKPTAVDFVFVLTTDDRCWLIPSCKITSNTTITVGTEKYQQYQITGERKEAFTTTRSKVKNQISQTKQDRRVKEPPFTKSELERLLLEVPITDIAKKYSMSDNGIARWAKKWNLQKHPRGYWQKKAANKI